VGAKLKMLSLLGIVQNYVDMIAPLVDGEEEALVRDLQKYVHQGFNIWGFKPTRRELKKIHSAYVAFQKKALSDGELEWTTYTALIIGFLTDVLSHIKDSKRRATLEGMQSCLADIYEYIADGDDDSGMIEATEASNILGSILSRFD